MQHGRTPHIRCWIAIGGAAVALAACSTDAATEKPSATAAGGTSVASTAVATTAVATTPSTGTGLAAGTIEPVSVVAAFAPLAELAVRIGGPQVAVTNLTPPGSEAHDAELTPKSTESLGQADVVIYLGRGFQPAVQDGVSQLPASVTRLDLLDSVELLPIQEEDGHSDGETHAEGEEHAEELDGGFDPHVWVDPANMVIMADAIASSLAALQPESAELFAANAKAYVGELNTLTADMTAGVATCASRIIVTGHEAFAYLAKRLDLTQIAIAGISPEIEPNPKDLEAIAKQAKEAGVKMVFFEEALPKDLAETVANEIGADTGSLNPVETLSQEQLDAGTGYIEVQRENLASLRLGLVCS
jgi:zinc transport system substrate-binding protein